MKIELKNIAKRYKLEWVLRNLNLSLRTENAYAIIGPNGSGKSTLLKILSGHLTPTKGKIDFFLENKKLPSDEVYQHLSYAAPYIDLIEEFTLLEALQFHQNFKPFIKNQQPADIIQILGFERAKNKSIRHFSSGMKQRLKLALAICSDTNLLLLDEPTATLDRQGIEWYQDLIRQFADNRLVIVASNVEEDFFFCAQKVNMLDFKRQRSF
ncbi:MAG: ABC transporter ATP-binding protein [Saprospiraceae bacterium]|nr:ABC transporter ATP-binding protein [Saprospiraceae bacterium]